MKQQCLVLVYTKDVIKPVVEFLNWKKQLATGLKIPEERGYTFALLNVSAPSISGTNDMAFFGSCAQTMVQGQNLMAVIMPQFAYKKGQLAMASRAVEDLFINRGLAMDNKWALVFNHKPDSRDNRSLVFDGCLITPNGNPNDFVFKNTPIMHGRTEMADMLPGHRMQVIEDVSADAVW